MTVGVYVRSVGAWTPLGASWPITLERLARGEGAIGTIDTFDAEGFPCRVAAAIPECRSHERDPRSVLGLHAGRQAWELAGARASPERIGVFVGAEAGRPSFSTVLAWSRAAGGGEIFDAARFASNAAALADTVPASVLSPATVASELAALIGARGPVETISLACASGSAAILQAHRAIRLGICDVALAGGVGADVDPFLLAGFGLLGALSARGVSRPFDARRDGFVLGEGAAMVVLSRNRDGAEVELAGTGLTLDGYRLTAPEPSGASAARAMQLAMSEAGTDEVDYVQAHGTSTPLNDAVEAAILRRILGHSLERAHVSSVKGALGHSIAAAGAMGLLCAVEAIRSGTVLPTVGLEEPDPECALPHVTKRAIRTGVRTALVNAFAFGGANCCLILRRCE